MGDVHDEPTDWASHHWRGPAGDFHALDLGAGRAVWSCTVDAPALILGSAQSFDDVDMERAERDGIAVVRRRSGGGAVYVDADECIWIDVTIPRSDPLWRDDVGESMMWLGEAFVEAVAPWVTAQVHRGPYESGRSGRRVCFASRAPGEVLVEGAKLVGISQRRNRDGARFQCAVYRAWNPGRWSGLLRGADAVSDADALDVALLPAQGPDVVQALLGIIRR